jgi:alpha-glucosidase (family GH31 glycosyl hydrolase)
MSSNQPLLDNDCHADEVDGLCVCLVDGNPPKRITKRRGHRGGPPGGLGTYCVSKASRSWPGNGKHTRSRAWWLEKRRYLVEDIGIDGFKTDGGEHGWGHDLRYADGVGGGAGNNLFPVHYAAAYHELLSSCGKPPVTFSRAGFTGSQAHGVFWAGDEDSTWEAMRSSLRAGLTAAACGIVYWGWDIAGFSGPAPDAELSAPVTGRTITVDTPVDQIPVWCRRESWSQHRSIFTGPTAV